MICFWINVNFLYLPLFQLLQEEPELRLTLDEIRMHPFFKTTNWDDLVKQGN